MINISVIVYQHGEPHPSGISGMEEAGEQIGEWVQDLPDMPYRVPVLGDQVDLWGHHEDIDAGHAVPTVESVNWSADFKDVRVHVDAVISSELAKQPWREALQTAGYSISFERGSED